MKNILRLLRNLLCCRACGDQFFNRDSSLEIDRLTVALEQMTERCRELEKR